MVDFDNEEQPPANDNNIVGVRKCKRDTPPRRRVTSLDQQEQVELKALEDQGTELLIDFKKILFLTMGFYAQWMLACQHNFRLLMIGFGCILLRQVNE